MANPLGLQDLKSESYLFVIFGATGNLAKKRIFPALFALAKSNLLPESFRIIAAARSQFTSQIFRKILPESLNLEDKKGWEEFAAKIDYIPVDIAEGLNLEALIESLEDSEKKICSQRIFYMSIAPDIFEKSIETLGKNGLTASCIHGKKPRVIIEKPFGWNLKSAKSLNTAISKYFSPEQVYRIDHYLGKETVQNIFAFRFANEIFEPVWSNQYIDNVQITMGEAIGVEKRGAFYDKTGALRDIIQNHLLQILTLVTIDAPRKFDTKSINEEKLKIIKSIKKLTMPEINKQTIRGQYQGYLKEENVRTDSQTETYALTKLFVENSRWQGVPFYLRAAKKMPGKITSVILQFKKNNHKLFQDFSQAQMPNHITIQIQPNEGIGLQLIVKKPGLATEFEPVNMEFCYKTSFDTPQPEAYERLLLDVMLGDQSHFMAQEIIEECWKVIDPIAEAWSQNLVPIETYPPGSWGPKAADDFIKRDNRQWLAPLLTVCKI